MGGCMEAPYAMPMAKARGMALLDLLQHPSDRWPGILYAPASQELNKQHLKW